MSFNDQLLAFIYLIEAHASLTKSFEDFENRVRELMDTAFEIVADEHYPDRFMEDED